jgi:hypothetical protein
MTKRRIVASLARGREGRGLGLAATGATSRRGRRVKLPIVTRVSMLFVRRAAVVVVVLMVHAGSRCLRLLLLMLLMLVAIEVRSRGILTNNTRGSHDVHLS